MWYDKKHKQSELTFLMFKDFLSEVSFIELNTVQNHHIILTSDWKLVYALNLNQSK